MGRALGILRGRVEGFSIIQGLGFKASGVGARGFV